MAAVLIDICDAVAAVINTAALDVPGTLNQTVTAATKLIPRNLKNQLTAAIADVKPAGAKNGGSGGGTRSRVFTHFAVEVGIAKKVDVTDATEADAKLMIELFDQIDAEFRLKRLTGYTNAIWVDSQYTTHMSEENHEEDSVYLGVLHLVFGVSR